MEIGSNFVAIPALSLLFDAFPTNLIQTLLEIPTGGDLLADDQIVLEGFPWALLKLLTEISGIKSTDKNRKDLFVIDQIEINKLALL